MQQILPTLVVVAAIAAAGCSWAPTRSADPVEDGASWSRWGPPGGTPGGHEPASGMPGGHVVETATRMIGAPYRWGGSTPAGFDCSGLVYFTFRQAGIEVPRTSAEQYRAAWPVAISAARPGDLVFFGRRGRISHVGIYIGDEHFIHAPDRGQPVKVSSIREDYYRARLAGAGRFN